MGTPASPFYSNLKHPRHASVIEDIPPDAQFLDGTVFMGLVCRTCGLSAYARWEPGKVPDARRAWRAIADALDDRGCWPSERDG